MSTVERIATLLSLIGSDWIVAALAIMSTGVLFVLSERANYLLRVPEARADAIAERLRISLARPSALPIEVTYEAALAWERVTLLRFVSILGSIAATAPFIGLLGTILEIVPAFAAAGTPDGDGLVMLSVSRALSLTCIGLVVAIASTLANNGIHSRVTRRIADAEARLAKRFGDEAASSDPQDPQRPDGATASSQTKTPSPEAVARLPTPQAAAQPIALGD